MPPKNKYVKRKRDEEIEEEEEPAYICYEYVDAKVLKDIYEMDLPAEHEHLVNKLYEVVQKSTQRFPVKYFEKEPDEPKRIGATGPTGQKLPKWMRRLLTWRSYIDIDIQNCGPTLTLQLLEREFPNDCFPQITRFLKDRDNFYLEISPNRAQAKDLTIQVINGAAVSGSTTLELLSHEMREYARKFKDKYKAKYNQLKKTTDDLKPCTFLQRYVAVMERQCLDAMMEFAKKNNWTVGTTSYDGMTVERSEKLKMPLDDIDKH